MRDFASRLIAWQKVHGRHDLPWQNTRDPYAIWVSEIMLQQTQVTAVIGYYGRFMQRFPDIKTLAEATQDEVLQHWSGLGYYSRARNLHRAAHMIMEEHAGKFPQDVELIQQLPGIGRSTAAAIASFAFDACYPILDGNVKRVFARHFVIEGWPGQPKVEASMWALAESLLPASGMVAYTQGLMDMGATLCTRTRPQCSACPLQTTCGAYLQGRTHALPSPKPRKSIPEKTTTMLVLLRGNEVLLEKRPPSGIWGGLWSFPEITDQDTTPQEAALQRFSVHTEPLPVMPMLTHTFTHFRLHITPQPLQVVSPTQIESGGFIWLDLHEAIEAAIPTPVRTLLKQLVASETADHAHQALLFG